MSLDYTTLKSEIQSDPKGMGYSALVSSGNDQALADLFNAITGPGAESVSLSSLPRDDFLRMAAPVFVAMASLSAGLQAKWDRILGVILAASKIDLADTSIQGLFALAVSDGVLTSGQVTALTTRTGSRAEKLFGAGVVLASADISYGLRGAR